MTRVNGIARNLTDLLPRTRLILADTSRDQPGSGPRTLPRFDFEDAKDWREFRRSYLLYMAAHEDSFGDDKAKILFVLSFMKKGMPGEWAENYFESALSDGFGTWKEFQELLKQAFEDPNAKKNAQRELEQLHQGTLDAGSFF